MSQDELYAVTARVVDEFTSAAMLFTALDVSNAVKKTLPDVRHREVSPLVRAAFDRGSMGRYRQTLIDVIAEGRKPAQAFLYHLPTQPTSNYDDSMRNQLAIPPVPAGAEDEDTTITDDHAGEPFGVGLDGRGRGVHLHAEIADDGIGGADPGNGSGLRGLADRVEALGGSLQVESPAGRGTSLRAEIPR